VTHTGMRVVPPFAADVAEERETMTRLSSAHRAYSWIGVEVQGGFPID
jgi:hypothetical protein